VRRADGSLRPRFWNRLLFPIHDLRGRVVGFGGRVLGEGEPKYLNSPDTPIFHKGTLLYNLHAGKHAIRKAERAVVVEGYFDVLRLVEAGVEEVIAPLGTALTPDQAQLVKRYTKNVVLLYDNDAAGLRASFRAADVLLQAGLRVTVATLPAGQDPDSLVLEGGPDAVRSVLDDALDVFERKLQLLERKGWLGSLAGRRRALDRLLPTLRSAADPVTRDLYIMRCAEALGISRESVVQEAERGPRPGAAPRRAPPAGAPAERGRGRRRGSRSEYELLRVMVHEPAWRARIAERLATVELRPGPERELLEVLSQVEADVAGGELLDQVEGEARGLLVQLLAEEWGQLNVDAIVDGALGKLESRVLVDQLRAIDRQITVASEDEKMELVREKESLSRRIARLDPGYWNVITRRRSGSAR
jgi:DNA primase